MIYAIIAVTVLFLLVLSPMFSVFSGKLTGKRAKRRLTYNLCGFGVVMLAGLFMPAFALAAPAETAGFSSTCSYPVFLPNTYLFILTLPKVFSDTDRRPSSPGSRLSPSSYLPCRSRRTSGSWRGGR